MRGLVVFANRIRLLPLALLVGIPFSANAEPPSITTEFHAAVRNLNACFEAHYEPRSVPEEDDSQAAVGLLQACADEWDKAASACEAGGVGSREDCNANTGLLAGAFLKLKQAGAK